MSASEPIDGLGDPRRHVWLLIIGVALLAGVGVTVYRARNVPVVSANETARQELVRRGVDPSSELRYEHFLYFASKSQATIAVSTLRGDFEVSGPDASRDAASGLDWSVTARQDVALGLKALDQLTRRLESLATGLGGVYDGWAVDLTGVTPSIWPDAPLPAPWRGFPVGFHCPADVGRVWVARVVRPPPG